MQRAIDSFGHEESGQTQNAADAEAKRFLVGVHLNHKLLTALEKYRSSLDDDVSRPRAIRQILLAWLKANGQL